MMASNEKWVVPAGPDARRFELPNAFHDHLGLATSIGLLLELGGDAIDAYTHRLGEPLLAWARERGVRVVSPPEGPHRSAIVCVAPPEPQQAHRRLREAGILCSLREGSLRFAPHCYNTVAEVERAVEVLEEVERER